MNKRVLFFVIACSIAARGAQVNKAAKSAGVQGAHSPRSSSAPSGERIGPQSFEGTWQGVCYGYGALNQEPGSQSSLTVMLTVKAAGAGKLSGITSTGPWQHQPIQNPRPSLGEPPPPPAPPPPLPASPPSGKISNPRTEGRTFVFEVKGPDGNLVDFRLRLQGLDAGTRSVTIPTHSRVYPELQMKRAG